MCVYTGETNKSNDREINKTKIEKRRPITQPLFFFRLLRLLWRTVKYIEEQNAHVYTTLFLCMY
jgi:hypothetical protein